MLKVSKNEKVGIVTLYHDNHNFGGLLQAYALPVALERYLGISAEQIDYVFKYQEQPKTKGTMSLRSIIYYIGYVFFTKLEKKNLQKRKQAFEEFIKFIPHSNHSYEFDTISQSLDIYTEFICGGDQIWNDCQQINWYRNEDSIVFTLQFVPENVIKISYAPSMAVLELTDEYKKNFRKGVNRLDAISLRERRALPVLQELTDKPLSVTVDPVLLLEKDDWMKIIRYPQVGQKYILCYLLGDSLAQRKAVKIYSSKIKCKILTFPHILKNAVRKCDLLLGDIHDYTSGPCDFLGLIDNAEIVITDSFHACVFAMIFQKPFVVFERDIIGAKENMNSRIYDFLEEYHLEKQLVTAEVLMNMNKIPKVDFTYAHEHWKERREESLEFLENALKDD
ncbi:MAG: polysaccharide pyruvyl transferase family protein [Anaerobutyricum hallii]|uniref:polysaccharide pyruvyl transferase family protein n=1 Tax=Anaerobutyricum hallii TaxID=39488 RepID=UPI002A7ECD1B|nr:polysaccharide pyruvyl transferase family protein [Anaerobutyricum hallii]MDY4576845.1 polysaccharide pyruvyl transferase family protein [Anaerobutyricum hallii]